MVEPKRTPPITLSAEMKKRLTDGKEDDKQSRVFIEMMKEWGLDTSKLEELNVWTEKVRGDLLKMFG